MPLRNHPSSGLSPFSRDKTALSSCANLSGGNRRSHEVGSSSRLAGDNYATRSDARQRRTFKPCSSSASLSLSWEKHHRSSLATNARLHRWSREGQSKVLAVNQRCCKTVTSNKLNNNRFSSSTSQFLCGAHRHRVSKLKRHVCQRRSPRTNCFQRVERARAQHNQLVCLTVCLCFS